MGRLACGCRYQAGAVRSAARRVVDVERLEVARPLVRARGDCCVEVARGSLRPLASLAVVVLEFRDHSE